MKQEWHKYLLSCFLLTLPVLAWNIFLAPELPAPFQPVSFGKDIPLFLMYGENISRSFVFLCMLLMPLQIRTSVQKAGIGIYISGIVVYFASWIMLIYFPGSTWSNSAYGFMAPAYTPILWLSGIALAGRKFYFRLPYKPWILILISIIFLVFHNIHTWIIYHRLY